MNEIPTWLLDARSLIEENMDNAGGAFAGEPREGAEDWDRGYWGGYWDACRHALKALPPYVKYPDPPDWREEGFEPPPEDIPA